MQSSTQSQLTDDRMTRRTDGRTDHGTLDVHGRTRKVRLNGLAVHVTSGPGIRGRDRGWAGLWPGVAGSAARSCSPLQSLLVRVSSARWTRKNILKPHQDVEAVAALPFVHLSIQLILASAYQIITPESGCKNAIIITFYCLYSCEIKCLKNQVMPL